MPVDTFFVYSGVYANVGGRPGRLRGRPRACTTEAQLIDALRRGGGRSAKAGGKVKIVKKHETARPGSAGCSDGGVGLATGLVIALFPAAAIGGGLLLATGGGGAVLGAVAGHAAAGMSRGDLKELGEQLDKGSGRPRRRGDRRHGVEGGSRHEAGPEKIEAGR